jgi:hypothetical protein
VFYGFKEGIQMFPMFFNTFEEDQNIININNSKMRKRIEDVIHNILEFTGCILQTKRHNIPLIVSKRSSESSFIPILVTYLNLPKSRFHIKFGKN